MFSVMNDEEQKIRFIAFCVEQFKHRHGCDGVKAMDCFRQNGIIDFLSTNFDVEHSLGADAILDDIDAILRRKGGAI